MFRKIIMFNNLFGSVPVSQPVPVKPLEVIKPVEAVVTAEVKG